MTMISKNSLDTGPEIHGAMVIIDVTDIFYKRELSGAFCFRVFLGSKAGSVAQQMPKNSSILSGKLQARWGRWQ